MQCNICGKCVSFILVFVWQSRYVCTRSHRVFEKAKKQFHVQTRHDTWGNRIRLYFQSQFHRRYFQYNFGIGLLLEVPLLENSLYSKANRFIHYDYWYFFKLSENKSYSWSVPILLIQPFLKNNIAYFDSKLLRQHSYALRCNLLCTCQTLRVTSTGFACLLSLGVRSQSFALFTGTQILNVQPLASDFG